MTTKEKKYKFLEVFEKYLGNISQSCKVIGIDRKTYYNWINKDNNFKNKVNEILYQLRIKQKPYKIIKY